MARLRYPESFSWFTICFSPFSGPDIIIGSLNANRNHSHDCYESSIPYIWDDITLCFRYPEGLPKWQYIFLIFDDGILWLGGLALLIVALFCVSLLNEFENHHLSLWKLLICTGAAMMGVAAPFGKYCERNVLRVMVFFLLICIFWMISIYNALFFKVFLKPRYFPEIKAVEEAISANYSFIVTPELSVNFHLMETHHFLRQLTELHS